MGEEFQKTDLNTAAREGARSLPEAVAAMWKVHRLWEILLPMTSWVSGYSKNPVTQQRSSHV
jgi:hypothetical protein